MKYLFALSILLVIGCKTNHTAEIIKPNPKQLEWADAEIGVLIHYDLITYEPEYNWRADWDYNPDPGIFDPESLDTDQWMQAVKAAGANYAVLVAKHCVGFSLWPTRAHEYSVKNSPWKDGNGDLVREFINSCKKYGIKPGIYCSSSANGYYKVDNPGLVVTGDTARQREYNKVVETQLTELWSEYGELFEIWFDGGVLPPEKGGADIVPILEKHQQDAIVFQGPYDFNNLIRWVGNEEGVAPYPCWSTADSTTNASGVIQIKGLHGNPDGRFWCPGEADVPIRKNHSFQGGWFWKAGEDSTLRSQDELMDIYHKSVGRNTNLLLGIVINDKGLVPEADVELLHQFGQAVENRYSQALAETSGSGTGFTMDFDSPTEVDNIIMMEDISHGELVREYTVEGLRGDGWIELCKGTSIGHKRIERFETATVSKVRVSFTEYIDEPAIRKIAIHPAR
jgi:alpha-L-fucosidase